MNAAPNMDVHTCVPTLTGSTSVTVAMATN